MVEQITSFLAATLPLPVIFPWYIIFLRLTVPLLIFKFPLVGVLLSSLVDMYDWQFITLETSENMVNYQFWDKVFDQYYLIFAFIVLFRWKDKIARNIAVLLFSIRIIGVAAFFVSNAKVFLLFFPNVFENFFIFYLFYVWITKNHILVRSWKIGITVLSAIIIPKLFHEYFMHCLNKQPWEFYNVGVFLGLSGFFEEYANYIAWGGLFYLLPIAILLFWLKRKNSK